MSQNSPLRYPTTMPIIRRSVPIQQAIGGRAVKTGGVRRENTLASSPILSIVSVACILAHGVRRSDIVEADLELPGKTSVTTIGMAYVANTVANLSQRSVPLRQSVAQLVRFTLGDDQSQVHHRFQIPLQRPAVYIGA